LATVSGARSWFNSITKEPSEVITRTCGEPPAEEEASAPEPLEPDGVAAALAAFADAAEASAGAGISAAAAGAASTPKTHARQTIIHSCFMRVS